MISHNIGGFSYKIRVPIENQLIVIRFSVNIYIIPKINSTLDKIERAVLSRYRKEIDRKIMGIK